MDAIFFVLRIKRALKSIPGLSDRSGVGNNKLPSAYKFNISAKETVTQVRVYTSMTKINLLPSENHQENVLTCIPERMPELPPQY